MRPVRTSGSDVPKGVATSTLGVSANGTPPLSAGAALSTVLMMIGAATPRVVDTARVLDPLQALHRTLEREASLLWNLKELMGSIDESSIGPATRLLPRWQIERIEAAIEASEEELEMLNNALSGPDRSEARE